MRDRLKQTRTMFIMAVAMMVVGTCFGCSGPAYTWSYEHSASPVATSAYIRAVMAAEAGEDEIALKFYDAALSREYSERAQEERDAVAKRIKAKKAGSVD